MTTRRERERERERAHMCTGRKQVARALSVPFYIMDITQRVAMSY